MVAAASLFATSPCTRAPHELAATRQRTNGICKESARAWPSTKAPVSRSPHINGRQPTANARAPLRAPSCRRTEWPAPDCNLASLGTPRENIAPSREQVLNGAALHRQATSNCADASTHSSRTLLVFTDALTKCHCRTFSSLQARARDAFGRALPVSLRIRQQSGATRQSQTALASTNSSSSATSTR